MAIAILVLVLLLLVRPVVRSVLSYHRTASLLEDRRGEVRELAQRHSELQELRAYYGTDVFLAERARRYGMTRSGEQAFVIRELAGPSANR